MLPACLRLPFEVCSCSILLSILAYMHCSMACLLQLHVMLLLHGALMQCMRARLAVSLVLRVKVKHSSHEALAQ